MIMGILHLHETGKPFLMTMDLGMSREDQDKELIALYKQSSVEWACPLRCRLQGNTGSTCVFEGLKETKVWPLLIARKDVELFPRECEYSLTPQMVLPYIRWPNESCEDEDEDDDDVTLETKCRISGYLRQFIETVFASSTDLKELVKFWVGWEVPGEDMVVEIVNGQLPKSSTCFCTLCLPGHYTNFSQF
ncbi:hypothetical protein SKAU_G00415800 [Synaphobranchus kaupii]|uniref:Uncharacterized protein n=1 Tax=Synaphobranchus kaupii TaxID=118154 RepID=A0A9Q1IBG6_SYNKA|nr:hypothetical protein SKAU_G00415800 [Synaphobranchus kaupii]